MSTARRLLEDPRNSYLVENWAAAHRLADSHDPVQPVFADEVRDGVGQGGDRDLAG